MTRQHVGDGVGEWRGWTLLRALDHSLSVVGMKCGELFRKNGTKLTSFFQQLRCPSVHSYMKYRLAWRRRPFMEGLETLYRWRNLSRAQGSDRKSVEVFFGHLGFALSIVIPRASFLTNMSSRSQRDKNQKQNANQAVLTELLKEESNRYCSDCQAKGL